MADWATRLRDWADWHEDEFGFGPEPGASLVEDLRAAAVEIERLRAAANQHFGVFEPWAERANIRIAELLALGDDLADAVRSGHNADNTLDRWDDLRG